MSDSERTVLLEGRALRKVYPNGDVEALRSVDIQIFEGEYVSIMGTSGSGKSTLLCTLSGMDTPTSGEVLYRGEPLPKHASLDRFRALELGFVFQSFYLLPTLTALENVQVPMLEGPARSGKARRQRAAELLELVGISHRGGHLPMRLSVGERQRVAIARSLANSPQVIFADEPTGNLDSRTTDEILALFARLHKTEGVTLVMVTHSADVAAHSERILHFDDGRIQGAEKGTASTSQGS